MNVNDFVSKLIEQEDDFSDINPGGESAITTPEEALSSVKKRYDEADFEFDQMFDAWSEHVTSLAPELLTDAEADHLVNDDDRRIEACQYIIKAFVLSLALNYIPEWMRRPFFTRRNPEL